ADDAAVDRVSAQPADDVQGRYRRSPVRHAGDRYGGGPACADPLGAPRRSDLTVLDARAAAPGGFVAKLAKREKPTPPELLDGDGKASSGKVGCAMLYTTGSTEETHLFQCRLSLYGGRIT